MHPGDTSRCQKLPRLYPPPIPLVVVRPSTYLLEREEEEEEEAIFCSSRKRTLHFCGAGSSGDGSSELLPDEDGSAGNGNERETGRDLYINTRFSS